MPNSPEADHPPRQAVENAVNCIEQDFRRVIETLGRVLDVVDPSDEQVTAGVRAMMDFAERGMDLSQQLLKVITTDRS